MKKKLFTLACAATTFAGVALADYPEKPVSFVVPWPPGDLEDVLTRIIANKFQDMYGVSTAVVNKSDGGGAAHSRVPWKLQRPRLMATPSARLSRMCPSPALK